MGEVSAAAAVAAAAAAPEGVLHRRIEFHLARKPQAAAAVGGGGFRMETLNPDAAVAAAAAPRSEGEARRLEKGEASGLDPELSVARIYLGRIGAGLNNLGNTCYLNSVLQCLTYTEPFAAYLQSGRHKSSCRTTGFCALCALQNHVKTALQSTGKIVTPLQIIRNLSCISHRFCKSRQEDAHELMVNLLESMHKCCLPSDVPIESPSAYEKSLVHRIFGGRLRSQVKCTRCLHCSNKFDPFLDLSLDIAKASTLLRALKNFTEEEVLDGGEKQYQCERCRQKVVAKKRFTIDKAPNVLTVHLKRFSPFNPRVKIDKKVDFPPVLDLKPFISDSKGTDCTYSLYGVLVHCGVNTQGGHYYCFVRTSSGMWHNLDDNQVRQVREADVLKQQAYMLFYVRDRVGNTMVRKGTSAGIMPGKKMTTEKISCLNGVIQSGVAEAKLNGSSPPYVDKKLQSISIGHSGVINKTSPDHLSKNDCKTEAVVVSQNNGLSSAHKALVPRNDGATLPIKSKQIAMSCLNELSSSSQSASLIDTSSDHTLAETPLQEPKTDGAFTKLGNSTFAASPVVSSLSRLSQADQQTSQSQKTISSKTISNVINMDAGVTAQTFVTKDAVVSNGDVPSNGSSTPVEEMKDSMASLDKTVKELPINKNNVVPGLEKLDVGKEICPEVSMNVVAASSCNASVAKKVVLKSKKLVRYPVVNLWLGPRQLLLGSLKSQKKRKHKRAKKMSAACKNVTNIDYSGHNISEQQTSTSAAAPTENVECTPHGQKRDYASAFSENDTLMLKKKQQIVGAGAGDHILDKRNSKCATFGGDSDLIKSDPSSSVNQAHLRNNGDAKLEAFQPISILTRDLKEVAVPCWDNVAIPNIEAKESNHSKSKSIGYVLDEWDEEYDCGRVKKVRKSKEDYGGPNPFQEETNFISQQRMKQRSYQGKSWSKPTRLDELRI